MGPQNRSAHFGKHSNLFPQNVNFSVLLAMKVRRGSRCTVLLCPNLGARWQWVVNVTPRPLWPREEPHYSWEGGGLKADLKGI